MARGRAAARGVSSARRHLSLLTQKRTSAYADRAAGRRQACSRTKPNVALLDYATFKCERGRANVLELTRARPVRSGGATQRVALTEPRKRRAKRRPCVGCCDELGGPSPCNRSSCVQACHFPIRWNCAVNNCNAGDYCGSVLPGDASVPNAPARGSWPRHALAEAPCQRQRTPLSAAMLV